MKRRWVGCACLAALLALAPAGASAQRLDVWGNLWWSGTLRGPGYLRITQTSARPVRTEGCFEFERRAGKTDHFAGYNATLLPRDPAPRYIEFSWYAGGPRAVLIFCASEAPGRVTLEVSGRWSGARWGQTGISLLREWDLSPTPVRGTFRPFRFRRGANAWFRADQGIMSIRTSRGSDYGLWTMSLDAAPPGRYSLGLEAGAGLVLLAAVDVAW
ncbi:MAG: hypothetical protein HY775_13445 [Acidobacteria bacterium]|nr:hypothetical protein [Acidobacteriota bacterium]